LFLIHKKTLYDRRRLIEEGGGRPNKLTEAQREEAAEGGSERGGGRCG